MEYILDIQQAYEAGFMAAISTFSFLRNLAENFWHGFKNEKICKNWSGRRNWNDNSVRCRSDFRPSDFCCTRKGHYGVALTISQNKGIKENRNITSRQ